MSTANEREKSCSHEWEATEATSDKSHVKLICKKCGAIKEIELFP